MSKNAETKKHVLDILKASLSHLLMVQSSQTGHLTLCIRALNLKPVSSRYKGGGSTTSAVLMALPKPKAGVTAHPAAARCLIQLQPHQSSSAQGPGGTGLTG